VQVGNDGSINGDRRLINVGVKDCYEWWFSGFNYFVQVG